MMNDILWLLYHCDCGCDGIAIAFGFTGDHDNLLAGTFVRVEFIIAIDGFHLESCPCQQMLDLVRTHIAAKAEPQEELPAATKSKKTRAAA